ncbi:MAG: secondary thiamine-phosphate synthase enzyme YjbQ [Immundisolibacter sp.]
MQTVVARSGVLEGLCHVFLHHTSAGLIITENADPAVHRDLLRWLDRLAPMDRHAYEHATEGPDDMPAHLKAVLGSSALTVPVAGGRCDLGTWQGIYLAEFRRLPQRRRLTVSVWGAAR